ncbi:uncharacterized protein LOC144349436 [Saccoglossus kowalevskii]
MVAHIDVQPLRKSAAISSEDILFRTVSFFAQGLHRLNSISKVQSQISFSESKGTGTTCRIMLVRLYPQHQLQVPVLPVFKLCSYRKQQNFLEKRLLNFKGMILAIMSYLLYSLLDNNGSSYRWFIAVTISHSEWWLMLMIRCCDYFSFRMVAHIDGSLL